MGTYTFTTQINAPKEKVWEVLWADETYRKWTSVFNETSYAVSDWEEGGRVLFLSAGGNGMYSIIEKKVVNSEMWFKHIGEIVNGEEKPGDWGEATEQYSLAETSDGTQLQVIINIVKEHGEYFKNIFPKALEAIKTICEA